MIPAGLKKGETEFFVMHNDLSVMHNGVITAFESLPEYIFVIIDASIGQETAQALRKWGFTSPMAIRKKFIECNCGTYDFTPDICDKTQKLQLEYVECSQRGICKYEGVVCQPVTISGERLTMAELRIISLIRAGYYDKEICDNLQIALDTLRTHKKSIQTKLNASRKTEIAIKSIQFGIA